MATGNNKAFLLIEILVTVVIVSTCLIFINHAFTSSFKAAGISSDYISAAFLLDDKSFDFESNPELKEGESSGGVEFLGRNFSWTQTVSSLEKEETGDEYEEGELDLKRLKLSVGWNRQGVERNIDIVTYVNTKKSEE